MADSSYQFIDQGNHQIVILSSAINDASWDIIEEIRAELTRRLQELSKPRVILDISALEYMGSAMVALAIQLWKAIETRQGQMVVVNQDDTVLKVLAVAGLASRWKIVATQSDALSLLRVARSGANHSGGGLAGIMLKILVALLALVGVAAIVYLVLHGGLPR